MHAGVASCSFGHIGSVFHRPVGTNSLHGGAGKETGKKTRGQEHNVHWHG